MATRKQKASFAIKRFKGFWNQFKRSKRGMIGLAIIIIFILIGAFGPLVAPYPPIDPVIPAGKSYPGVGAIGIKIAHQLCKPFWYKYLPWITRGEVEVTEVFYNYNYNESGIPLQFFIAEEKYLSLQSEYSGEVPIEAKQNASVNPYLSLSRKVSKVDKIEVVFQNGTLYQLSYPDEWKFSTGSTSDIRLTNSYPDDTKFTVYYKTGVDLVENMKLVEDHMFTKSESFNQWTWSSNYENLVSVKYDDTHGFAYGGQIGEEGAGCISVSYAATDTSISENVIITVIKEFKYPYYESPQDLFIHASIWNNGSSPIKLQLLFIRENETFNVKQNTINPSTNYIHLTVSNIAKLTLNKIFAAPSNYSFAVRITVPYEENATVYLDNLDCLLYGNIFGWLGTDNNKPYANDIFSGLVYGARVSLIVGLLTAIFSTFIGLFLGLISGYVGGIVDEGIMRFTDLLLVLPTLPLFIVLTVSMRAASGYVSMWNIIIILTLFGWMSFARSVRSMVLSLRERAFIEAAKAAGGGRLHIINRHVLPNVFALVYITLAMSVPGAIITEASLSWLGLGDPRLASWGKILYDFNSSGVVTSKGLLDYWFWVFPACLAIALLASAFVLVGYALDEILNPRLRERQ
ncbi:MAG: ABC transporter permease [Candidatus Bathyarchaeia archaeon]